jgi:CubicO group peptidase (beta-lactamase class C family)
MFRAVISCVVGAIIALCGAVLPCHADSVTDALVGHWYGVNVAQQGDLHSEDFFDFEFIRDQQGVLFRDNGRFAMVGDPVRVAVSPDGSVRAEWQQMMQVSRSVTARLVDNGTALDAHIGTAGFMESAGELQVRLTRASPANAPYLAPRTAEGRKVTRYTYSMPTPVPGSWPVATPESVGIDRAPLVELANDILREGDRVSDRRTDGVLVLRHGKLVFEEYFWGMRRELTHIIASDTKSISSTLAGIAIDQGKLGLDEPVTRFFPTYGERLWLREKYPIRVRDLLSMTAGVEWPDKSAATGDFMRRMLQSGDHVGFVLDLRALEPPGKVYTYNNGLPILLGEILTQALREPVDVFADRQLFKPLGIRNYTWTKLPSGIPWLTGGMTMPPRDMAKIGQLMLDEGVWDGKRLVSKDWVTLATTRQTRPAEYPYGFLWHLSSAAAPWHGQPSYFGPVDKYDAFTAIGQGGQIIMVLPEVDVVVVVVSSNWMPGFVNGFPTDLVNRYVIPAIRRAQR